MTPGQGVELLRVDIRGRRDSSGDRSQITLQEQLVGLPERGDQGVGLVLRQQSCFLSAAESVDGPPAADLIAELVRTDPRAHERPITIQPLTVPRTVEDIYTRAPVTARPDQDVADVVDVMSATGFKSLPVVDDQQRLVGIVSRSDVVRALARDDALIADDILRVFRDLGHPDWKVTVTEGLVEITGPDAAEHSLAHTIARTAKGVVGIRIL
jgi:CBS domain-containing protein